MTQLLQNAVCGTVLILAVVALRGTLRDRLLPEARLTLWAVCLFRLFTPVAPASPLSFWGLFGRGMWGLSVSAPAAPVAPAVPAAPDGPPPFWGLFEWEAWELPASVPSAPTAPAAPSAAAVLTAVWTAVGVILAARYVLTYLRTRRAVGSTVPLEREDARYAALPRCARLREGPMKGAPLTFGVVRPTVVLPPGLDGAELTCVLAHEGVHVQRRDNLWYYAAAMALTVFWWDPAVWLMARLIRRDVELSCDRAAVRRLGGDRRAEYANALVTLSTQAEGGAFCHGFGPKRTEERIIAIMNYKKTTITGIALTLALVLAVTVGFASNPAADTPDEESTTSSAPAPLVWVGSFGPEGELLKFTVGLDYLEQLLMEHVDSGSMTGEGAAYYLEAAKALSQDGVKLEWTVPGDVKLFVDKGSMEMTFNIYWLDKNGNKVYLDAVEMLSYIITDNNVFVEIEDDFVCYDSTSDPDIILKEYKAVLDRAVARGVRVQVEVDAILVDMESLIERAKSGEIKGLMFNKQLNGEVVYAEELDETEAKPQVGVNVFYEDPEKGTMVVKLHYDAEKGVWFDPETGEEYEFCIDAEGYLDTGAVVRRHGEPVEIADNQNGTAEHHSDSHHESESGHQQDSHH